MTAAERQRRRREPGQIIVAMGGAWRLSATGYKRLVAAIQAGKPYDLDELGTFLGTTIDPSSLT